MTVQEKLNKMYKYVKGELTTMEKVLDKLMAGAEDPPIQPPVEPPTSPSIDPPTDNISVLKSGHKGFYNFKPREIKLFKFRASVKSCNRPIQVGSAPQSNSKRTIRMIIKRGSRPTISDYVKLIRKGSFLYDCRDKRYYPAKPASVKDYFWRFNTGSGGEFVEIFEPIKSDIFYIMLYNKGSKSVRKQRLTLYYW